MQYSRCGLASTYMVNRLNLLVMLSPGTKVTSQELMLGFFLFFKYYTIFQNLRIKVATYQKEQIHLQTAGS